MSHCDKHDQPRYLVALGPSKTLEVCDRCEEEATQKLRQMAADRDRTYASYARFN